MRLARPRAAPGAGEILRVVADANVVAAALVRPAGWSAGQLTRSDVEWVAPSFLFDELSEHAEEYAAKAGCTRREWQTRVAELRKRFAIVPEHELVTARGEIVDRVEAVDPDDVAYAAALVASGADLLWTRDRALLAALPGVAVSVVPEA